MAKDFREVLLKEMQKVKTIDCHSHTRLKKVYYEEGPFDLFSLMSYFDRDIVTTAGNGVYDGAETDEDKWERLKGVLEKSRNVSYWRHNIVMYKELFGLEDDELNDTNWSSINKAIKEKSNDPVWYHHVTEDICNLRTQVRNIPWFEDWEPEYFTGTLRMEGALAMQDSKSWDGLQEYIDISIKSLGTAKEALLKLTEKYMEDGIVGIKLAHAYGRTLHSIRVDKKEAQTIFEEFLQNGKLEGEKLKKMQDYIIFFLADMCKQKDLVFQIHTGVQGNWGNVPESDPLLLIPLLSDFKDVKFDLFHAGYPYSREIGMLAKHYPNVWLNMAWMYVISVAGSRNLLREWFDLVPGYRILAFGSDVGYPEFIYAHLIMARECMADVLAEKVECDFMSEEDALSLVQRTFHDNAVDLYGLDS